jgi:hypothetical protein
LSPLFRDISARMRAPLKRSGALGIGLACVTCACGGQTPKAPARTDGESNRAVAVGEWCKTLTQLTCIRAGSCMGSLEIATTCVGSALASCLDGRSDDAPSGHTGVELERCATLFQNAACDGYMAAVASHTECQPRTP